MSDAHDVTPDALLALLEQAAEKKWGPLEELELGPAHITGNGRAFAPQHPNCQPLAAVLFVRGLREEARRQAHARALHEHESEVRERRARIRVIAGEEGAQ